MAINLRSTMLATICSLGLSQITTSILSAQQGPPDLSKLSSEQTEMIATACNVARQFNRPAKYYRCLRDQLGALRDSSGEPDLSDLSPEQQEMIASACNVARQFDGPAKYYACLRDQLGALRNSSEPDLSDLSPEQQEMIFNACRVARQFIGPASYYNCLRSQRAGLAAQIAPVTDPGTPTVSPPAEQPTSISPKAGRGTTPGLQTNPGIPSNLVIVFGAVIFLAFLQEIARRGKKCFTCGARTTNATQICDSCQERARAGENRRREEQTPSVSFNPYEVLGVSQGASREEIRSAYRDLIARYHPDKVSHLGQEFEAVAREKTLAINRAYEMLTSF